VPCVTADDVRQIVNVAESRGWSNTKIETRIGWSENRLKSRLAPAFGAAKIAELLAAEEPPDVLKQIVLWLTAAEIYREVYGYRTEEGEPNPGAVWAGLAREAIKDLVDRDAAIIDAAGVEYYAASKVVHSCHEDTSILGGPEERYPGIDDGD
jgi:hypothetical protein